MKFIIINEMVPISLTSNEKLRKEIFQLWNYENISEEEKNDGDDADNDDDVVIVDDYSILIIVV